MNEPVEESVSIGGESSSEDSTALVPVVGTTGTLTVDCSCRRLDLTGLLSLRQWTKIEVTWHDAADQAGDHHSKKIRKAKSRCLVKTMGYLIDIDSEYMVLSSDDLRHGNTPGADCGPINEIPIGMIRKYKVLT